MTNLGSRVLLGPFDVVGLKLGMPQEETVKTIFGRELQVNGKPAPFEVVRERKHETIDQGAEPRTWFLNLSNAKSVMSAFELSEDALKNPAASQDSKVQQFVAGGQYETFVLQFPNSPNEARVSAISRLQRLAPPVHPDTIRNALIQKYGAPTFDGKFYMVWLTSDAGRVISPASKEPPPCHVSTAGTGNQLGEFDHSLRAIKGCGDQLTVQLQGAVDGVVFIRTILFHHQRLIDEREIVMKAALGRLGLTPEQSKKAPAPQF